MVRRGIVRKGTQRRVNPEPRGIDCLSGLVGGKDSCSTPKKGRL